MKESTSADSAVRLLPRWTQQDWMEAAACKGQTQHFFAPHGEQADARELREAVARAICVTCSVLLPCREYARRHREQGYWGAENDDQRLEARRRRPGPAPVPSFAPSARAN
ncbi:MAG TPA: WhiB family transcriptional regulator [Acidimicrobiales bacterium]|nr:WhiB family transcriptional regulator [Acidimicrobiales bacterium]